MLDARAGVQVRHEHVRVLVDQHHVAALGPDHLQQTIGSVLFREDPLLDAGLQSGLVGQDPDLDEPHRLGLGGVLFGVQRAGAQRHPLH